MSFLTGQQALAHNLFRIMFGFAFMTHGGQKLLGWFGGTPVESLMSKYGAAGIIELACGLLIMVGFQTNWAAFIASGEMAVAYFWQHAFGAEGFALFHWDNRGELPMLFCFGFLFLSTIGSGTYSVDALLAKRKPAA
jgi:putative oxidoreductase